MATITKETGTASALSTSYVSEADFTAYLLERNVSFLSGLGTVSETLIKAMDYLESKVFIGDKSTKEQSLMWPRNGIYIDGFNVASDEIPLLLQEAQMEIAISIDLGDNPLANIPRETIKEKVGDIEVEYSRLAYNQAYLKAANLKLLKLLKSTPLLVARI